MDQFIQRRIGCIQTVVSRHIFENIPLDDKDLCELYIENQFFEECYEIWNEIADEIGEAAEVRRLMRQAADTFYLAVISLFRAAPDWYEILPVFIAELLDNEFQRDDWYYAFERLNDPSAA